MAKFSKVPEGSSKNGEDATNGHLRASTSGLASASLPSTSHSNNDTHRVHNSNQFYQPNPSHISHLSPLSTAIMSDNGNHTINWRDEADGSEEDQIQFNFGLHNLHNNIAVSQASNPTFDNPPRPETDPAFDSDFDEMVEDVFPSTSLPRNLNVISNDQIDTSTEAVADTDENEDWQSILSFMDSFKKFRKFDLNGPEGPAPKLDQNINDSNQAMPNRNFPGDAKLNKTSNFNFHLSEPRPNDQRSPYRMSVLTRNNKNRKQQSSNNNIVGDTPINFRPRLTTPNPARNGSLPFTQTNDDNNSNDLNVFIQRLKNLLHRPQQEQHDSGFASNNNASAFTTDSEGAQNLDMNYFKLINQQVYQLLMLQNHQISQQHQLIMSWIDCQQEWLRKMPRDAFMTGNNNINAEASIPTVHRNTSGPYSNEIPESLSLINNSHLHHHQTMLNNQTVPGVRANNFWDNFKSQAFQNKLQSNLTSNRQYPNHDVPPSFMGPSNCNNSCAELCNKNRSHSFSDFSNPFRLLDRNNSKSSKNLPKNQTTDSDGNHVDQIGSTTDENMRNLDLNYILSMIKKLAIENGSKENGSRMVPKTSFSNATTSSMAASLKRKKSSNKDMNLSDLRECDTDQLELDHFDGDATPENDRLLRSAGSSKPKQQNFSFQYSAKSFGPIQNHMGKLKSFAPQKSSGSSLINEIIRPLMAAEGRSSEYAANQIPGNPGPSGQAKTVSKMIQQKVSFRPPITGNESNMNTDKSNPKYMPKLDGIKWNLFNHQNKDSNKKENLDLPATSEDGQNMTGSNNIDEDKKEPHDEVDSETDQQRQYLPNNEKVPMAAENATKPTATITTGGDSIQMKTSGSLNNGITIGSVANNRHETGGLSNDSGSSRSEEPLQRPKSPRVVNLPDVAYEDDDDDADDDNENDIRRPLPLVNGNANEVRSSVRLSGDGEQGL